LSPLKILDRGYAIVTDSAGSVIKDAAQAPVGSDIAVRLARGRLGARVTGAEP
jgi:exodeoxyribonuclease VII large subunit